MKSKPIRQEDDSTLLQDRKEFNPDTNIEGLMNSTFLFPSRQRRHYVSVLFLLNGSLYEKLFQRSERRRKTRNIPASFIVFPVGNRPLIDFLQSY